MSGEHRWVHIAGVIIAPALIGREEDRGALPQIWLGLHSIHNFFYKSFEEVPFRRGWEAIRPSARLHVRDSGQFAGRDLLEELLDVRDVRDSHGIVGHDLVLAVIAVDEIAVLDAGLPN